jgi:integrase
MLERRRTRSESKFVFPARGDNGRPQLTYQSAWTTACDHAKVKAVPYDLRRTFITRCMAENKSPFYVAKCLDTSTKMIESVYAKAQADVMEDILK